ncbi:hypothetical protein HY629_00800 [Candidatus Uhrbacteria bacterium]|nr:hypothetical protein [Candidatus Uhrbacteria bacterium]
MPRKQQLPKSIRVYLRREKARIRATVADGKEQKQKIQEVMRRYIPRKSM